MKVVILFGGKSVEHESSIHMYYSMIESLREEGSKYQLAAVAYIAQEGGVHTWTPSGSEIPPKSVKEFRKLPVIELKSFIASLNRGEHYVYSLLQGTEGEDGVYQGLAAALDLHSNLGGVFSSSLSMNKWAHSNIANILASDDLHEIPTELILANSDESTLSEVVEKFKGLACVIKPNDLGASVLCESVEVLSMNELASFSQAISEYSASFLVQRKLSGAEYSFGLIKRHGKYEALPAIRITSASGFLGLREKFSEGGFRIEFVPDSSLVYKKMERVCLKLASVVDYGTACRFDFIEECDKLYLLEVNSKPGLTDESHYTQMLKKVGLSLTDLLGVSMDNAVQEKHKRRDFYFEVEHVF
ncbi:hypothetical protein [Pseudomonas sp. R3-52-08]|uniref:hypothetical protein n=1 Tax=Pseudomonas sp. R3-52-08 TaxID=1173284 RepID=UPI000F58EA27|nr:hypothetical protein [Pseudomonas sp. R3-52-08]AZF21179.1 hypothetical protein C4J91_2429 [Pseudomonas sp. R3-52-08]